MNIRRAIVATSLLLCTSFLSLNPGLQQLAKFPEIKEVNQLNVGAMDDGFWSNIIKIKAEPEANPAISPNYFSPITNYQITYKLFGIFPLKTSEVKVMPPIQLYPGGQSIGVTLQAKGVMIVGQAPIMQENGEKIFPAKDAGIEVGDVILKIDGREVHSDQEVANAINEAGQKTKGEKVGLFIKHQGQILEKNITPAFCKETGRYRIGLFVRDEAAGVGTLTFIDPKTNIYGALGHVINDMDTNQHIEVSSGEIIASTIYGIEKGSRGHPGEKVGSFMLNSPFNGTINKNTNVGIFGKLKGTAANSYFKEPVFVGWESEVQEGPAKIYTVIQGDKIEEFNVEIERVMHNRTDSKNMVVHITDPKLLEMTGGIIQGMSGSPIVQNGKIIGAVTHVFVNDSSRGYGVFIQNMLKEAGILGKKEAA